MIPDGTPGGSAPGESRPAVRPVFPEQPLPTAGSVLWRPAVQELARPGIDPGFIFVAQPVIAAVEDQLRSGPHQGLVGFLVGRVLTNPDTGFLYVVIGRAMPVPQLSVAGASDRDVTQSLAALQRTVQPADGELVGWYRTQPSGEPRISAADHEAHLRSFQHPWHVALVVAGGPNGLLGGLFRPAGDPGSPVPYMPFFELLEASGDQGASSPSIVSWTNYWSPNPPPRRAAGLPHIRPSGERSLRRIPIAGLDTADEDDDDPAFRRRTPRREEPNHAWRWWVAAAAAVVVATVSVEEWWLHRPETPGAVPAATVSVAVEPAVSAEPVRRAIEAYRQRASLFANRQMTCADLAPGLADVDDEWLRYIKAAPPTLDRTLATEVEGVEDDFEHTGCPRP
jgi:proteasome lid subunit RPN8/RPN11